MAEKSAWVRIVSGVSTLLFILWIAILLFPNGGWPAWMVMMAVATFWIVVVILAIIAVIIVAIIVFTLLAR